MSFSVDLPPELLIEIFTYLGCKDLLRVGLACRQFKRIVKSSLELQYNIELEADDMVDGPRGPGTMTTAQRLQLLLDRRQRWRTLEWTRAVKVPLVGSCQAYELVGGVFAKSMGLSGMSGSRHLISTWLPSRSEGQRDLVKEDLGVPTRDFAIDPSQDLIALVDIDDRVHMRTISTNTPHKGAHIPELQTPVPSQIGSCFIQIVNDVVGMFFWQHGPGLIVWNWRTGEMVVACLPYDVHPLPHTPVLRFDLHPGTWDFAFLSNRAYMLTTVGGRGSIEIYAFQGHSSARFTTPEHVASLLLPATRGAAELHHFSTHSSPFLGGDVTKGKPFAASQADRVHMMSFHYGVTGPRYHLFVKNEFLLGFAKRFYGQHRTLRWEEWGPDNTRFLEHSVQFQWLRYVHGHRIVFPPSTVATWPNPEFRLCVIDFNVHPKRRDDPCMIKYVPNHSEPNFQIVDQASSILAGVIFEHDVITRLPYSVASKIGDFNYSGFMIDEERLIGMKLSMAVAGEDLSDIDVFTF